MKQLMIFTIFFVFSIHAVAADYSVDASHSSVGFRIRHLVTKVKGEFKDFEGTFKFDENKPENSRVKFKIKAGSINTNNKKRDKHLVDIDFFNVKKFPTITFVSKKVSASGKNKYKLEGDMTMVGVTKPVTFEAEYTGIAKDPWGGTRAGFSASALIDRKDFGMSWNKSLDAGGFILGDEVNIDVEIEAVQK